MGNGIGYCLNKNCTRFNIYLVGSKPHPYSAVVCKSCDEPLGMDNYENSLENQELEKNEERTKMENQHRKIKGYRELSQEEIDLMNEVKVKGAELGTLIEKISNLKGEMSPDTRWLEIGKTEIQQGLMAVTRAITKPEFF